MASAIEKIAQAIIDRCKHDPKFKQAVLKNLRKKLESNENEEHDKTLKIAIRALERLK